MEAASGGFGLAWALLLLVSSSAASAQSPTTDVADPGPRTVTVAFGIGNPLGWVGGQAEYYVAGDRVSLFAGLGYTPVFDFADPSGPTAALGLRGYTGGVNHRALLELSYSQVSVWESTGERNYGPGLQAGYQYTADGGFTVLTSLGMGLEFDDGAVNARGLLTLALGYTWR